MKDRTKILKHAGAAPGDEQNGSDHRPTEQAHGVDEQPATFHPVVEDDYWTQLEDDVALLMEVTGFDDDFCRSLVLQLYGVMGQYDKRSCFISVVSALRDQKPINQLDAKLQVHMEICHHALMRQNEIFLRPVRYELPDDFCLALLHCGWDTSRLEKKKFKIGSETFFDRRARTSTSLCKLSSCSWRRGAAIG